MDDPEAGAASIEYGLLAALVAGVIVGVVALLGPELLPGLQTVIAGL